METNVADFVELQATVNLGMLFIWLILVIHNVQHIHLLHVKTFQNNYVYMSSLWRQFEDSQ